MSSAQSWLSCAFLGLLAGSMVVVKMVEKHRREKLWERMPGWTDDDTAREWDDRR